MMNLIYLPLVMIVILIFSIYGLTREGNRKVSSASPFITGFWLFYYPLLLVSTILFVPKLNQYIGINTKEIASIIFIIFLSLFLYLPLFPPFFDNRISKKTLLAFFTQTMFLGLVGIILLAFNAGIPGIGIAFTFFPIGFFYHLILSIFFYYFYKSNLYKDDNISSHPFIHFSQFISYIVVLGLFFSESYQIEKIRNKKASKLKLSFEVKTELLAGEDLDNNLIRDDVEEWIKDNYSDKPAVSNALREASYYFQMQFIEKKNALKWNRKFQDHQYLCLIPSLSLYTEKEKEFDEASKMYKELKNKLQDTDDRKRLAEYYSYENITVSLVGKLSCLYPLEALDPEFFNLSDHEKSKAINALKEIEISIIEKDFDRSIAMLNKVQIRDLWPTSFEELATMVISSDNRPLIDAFILISEKSFYQRYPKFKYPKAGLIFKNISLMNVKYLIEKGYFDMTRIFKHGLVEYSKVWNSNLNLLEASYLYNRDDIYEYVSKLEQNSKNTYSFLTIYKDEDSFVKFEKLISPVYRYGDYKDPNDIIQTKYKEMFINNVTQYTNDQKIQFIRDNPAIKGRFEFRKGLKNLKVNSPLSFGIISTLKILSDDFFNTLNGYSFEYELLPENVKNDPRLIKVLRSSKLVEFKKTPMEYKNNKLLIGKLIADNQIKDEPPEVLLCGDEFNAYASANPTLLSGWIIMQYFKYCSKAKNKNAAKHIAAQFLRMKKDYKILGDFLSKKELDQFINYNFCYYYDQLKDVIGFRPDTMKPYFKKFELSDNNSCLTNFNQNNSEALVCSSPEASHRVLESRKFIKINTKEFATKNNIKIKEIGHWLSSNYKKINFEVFNCSKEIIKENTDKILKYQNSERSFCETVFFFTSPKGVALTGSKQFRDIDSSFGESDCIRYFKRSAESSSNYCNSNKSRADLDTSKPFGVRYQINKRRPKDFGDGKVNVINEYDCKTNKLKSNF